MTEPSIEYREPTIDERVAAKKAKAITDRKKMRPWLISAMIIAALWGLIASFAPQARVEGMAGMLGYMTGSTLATCLIAALVVGFFLWLIAGRRLQPYDSARHVGMLFITALLATVPMTAFKFYFVQQNSADAAVMGRIQAELQAQAAQTTEEAHAARTAFDQAQPITPQALSRPGGFDRARQALNQLESAQTQALEHAQTLQEDARRQIAASSASARGKSDFEEGYQAALPRSQRAAALAQENITNMREQLDVLARRRWVNQGGMFAFTSEADLAAFNALTERQQQIASELQALQQQGG